MNKHKLSDDEVPKTFADWLLEMGCPTEDIPSTENITRLCRGHYYMVWRSLMEHVESKDVIRQKRLQVFLDDMKRVKDAQNYKSNIIEPEELKVWREAQELSKKVRQAEERVAKSREQLKMATDKVSSKLSERNSLRTKVNNSNRRVWFLQKANEELTLRKQNLVETKHIADSLCHGGDNKDVKMKLEKCMSLLMRQCFSPPNQFNSTLAYPDPVACSSLVSIDNYDDTEDNMSALVKSPANILWSLIHDKRKLLISNLNDEGSRNKFNWNEKRTSARTVLSNTTALHCLISLETVKLKLQLKNVRRNLADTVTGLSEILTGPSCELLVLKCESACAKARVNTLKKLLEDLSNNSGVFSPKEQEYALDTPVGVKHIGEVDKAILRRKEDLRSVLSTLMKTERRIIKVKDSLLTLFEGFQKELVGSEVKRGIQLDLDKNSVQTVRRFYNQYKEKKSKNIDLSMEFDDSFNDDIKDPRFVDELKYYLRKFSLENNRKLVLKSGEKIWIFESINASMERFHDSLQTDDVTPSALLCQSISPEENLLRLIDAQNELASINEFVKALEQDDVALRHDFESLLNQKNESKLDRLKKQIKNNITQLEKSQKTLNSEKDILKLWSDNIWRKYISSKRLVNGQNYEQIEHDYLSSQNPF